MKTKNFSPSVPHCEMDNYIQELSIGKTKNLKIKTFVLAILGGAFVAFGGLFATTVSSGSTAISYGLARLLTGLVFTLGLILIIISGAELFTGSTIVSVALINKKINIKKLIENWMIVYFGNFFGAILVALLVFYGGQYFLGNGSVGFSTLNTAIAKSHYSFLQAVSLGILANILVCLAIRMTYTTKSIGAKMAVIIPPITAFVAMGLEHSIANMYFFTIALLVKYLNPAFAIATKLNLTDLTFNNFILNNLIPVTIGNIIGGVVIWLTYNFLYKREN